jgi:hypothetical protein
MMFLDLVGVLEDGSTPGGGAPSNPRVTLSFPLGSDVTIRFLLVTASGAAVPLTGGSLLFTLKKRYTDTDAVISRNGTLDAPSTGGANFRFGSTDTKNLTPGQHAYDIWFTDALGRRNAVVPTAPFFLEPAVTLPGQTGTAPPP